MARLIRSGDFVGPGEERAAAHIEQRLPASWVVICNKELVWSGGSVREVDFIVIGDHCVFAIEEKSWSGPIHGDENGWVLRSGESFGSPLRTADSAARRPLEGERPPAEGTSPRPLRLWSRASVRWRSPDLRA